MCKTYEAIYDLARHAKSNVLIVAINHLKVEGELYKCDNEENDCKCYEDVVTLKNAVVYCPKSDNKKEYEWINIPSKHIQAFAFKCCEKN